MNDRDPEAEMARAEAAYDAHREASYTTCPRCHKRVTGTIRGVCWQCWEADHDCGL